MFKYRTLFTRVGKIYLRIPQARAGSFLPSCNTKYQIVEKVLFLDLVEAHSQGVAIRKIIEEMIGDSYREAPSVPGASP